MSVTIDTPGRLVTLNGGLGDTQGAHYEFDPADAGVIGMRVAYRPFFDTFSSAAQSPWTKVTSGGHVDTYYESTAWDGSSCLGFSFDDTFPGIDGPQAHGMSLVKGFLGVRTGGKASSTSVTTHTSVLYTTNAAALLGNIAAVASIGGFFGSSGWGNAKAFWSFPTKAASSLYGAATQHTGLFSYASNKLAGLHNIPANPTEGAKWTVGLELRKGVDATIYMTVFYNSSSLTEDNLLDVFTSYDDFVPAFRVSRTNGASPEGECAFYPSSDLIMPSHFLFRWGGPSQKLCISALRYQYIYP